MLTICIYLFCWFCGHVSPGLLGKVLAVCACSVNSTRSTILACIVLSIVYSNTTHIYFCCGTLCTVMKNPAGKIYGSSKYIVANDEIICCGVNNILHVEW